MAWCEEELSEMFGGSKLNEACGLFGCVLFEGAAAVSPNMGEIMVRGLSSLQHRGNEGSGIVGTVGPDDHPAVVKGLGLVSTVFNETNLQRLKGCAVCIGHNRYSTAGLKEDSINCVQPFTLHTLAGWVAVAHNGELVNAQRTRHQIESHGVGLSTDSDSELISQLIAQCINRPRSSKVFQNGLSTTSKTKPAGIIENGTRENEVKAKEEDLGFAEELFGIMEDLPMSYSLLILWRDRIYAVRDRFGNRPLCIGELFDQDGKKIGLVASSESCAFLPIHAKFLREVKPAQILELGRRGLRVHEKRTPSLTRTPALCIFEYVYFSNPASYMEGQQVNSVRQRCGAELALEAPVDADLVTTVPDSAGAATLGYADQIGLPYKPVLWRNPYASRSFIQPNTRARKNALLQKFGLLDEVFRGKRLVLVDDSIVRGNTMGLIVKLLKNSGAKEKFGLLDEVFGGKRLVLVNDSIVHGNTMGLIIKLLKNSGAKEVHVRIACAPVKYPCFMGINIPDIKELLAHTRSEEQIRTFIGADSVKYLSVEGLKKAVLAGCRSESKGHCTACLTKEYPVEVEGADW